MVRKTNTNHQAATLVKWLELAKILLFFLAIITGTSLTQDTRWHPPKAQMILEEEPTPLHSAPSDTAHVPLPSQHADDQGNNAAPLLFTVHPVDRIPNWGAMRTPAQWNRRYGEIPKEEYVPVPSYDRDALTIPVESLLHPLSLEHIALLTAKLYYSTRHFGAYHLDSPEFVSAHAGIDLKLPAGTPVGAMGGGRVLFVRSDAAFGLQIGIQHHVDDQDFLSFYGHLESIAVTEGQIVEPGDLLGAAGATGNASAPHLHLQVDHYRGRPEDHPYTPDALPTRAEAERFAVHPLAFIEEHGRH